MTTAKPRMTGRLKQHLHGRDEGQSAIELAAFIPIVLIVLIILSQGIAAMMAASHVCDAARDGARAGERGDSVYAAVTASMPDWIDLDSITACGRGCVRVAGRAPIGIPGVVEVTHVQLSSEATFRQREGSSWR
ncbi:TadE/TadG family type IV pilus assembly protein [Actinomyces sp.]|uniref:TadE/TadG family type IV pilus assembly protein n=1 Tax=Actinomyces sp. TaxID=29317 RepID=UPI0026DD9B31|nr:TadE/TadG family type IV pilus assembly protein [Actinomyces sp.]MDO4901214.1 TadE/TadG family type IV pilus assembly protein [Actinomyces sp.]